jgi:hypothetical protein
LFKKTYREFSSPLNAFEYVMHFRSKVCFWNPTGFVGEEIGILSHTSCNPRRMAFFCDMK